MDEERKNWSNQLSANFGAEQFLRYGCAFVAWQSIGLGLTILFHNAGIVIFFFAITFVFPTLATRWQPAYSLFRIILGNKELPEKLLSNNKWWFYISLVVRIAFAVALIYIGIKLIFFK